MNIGIFVNSKTGNTLSVAEILRDKLVTLGHTVALEKVVASNDGEMNIEKIVISNPPSTQGYDMLVFAAPVNGFRPALAMQAFMQSLPSLEGKMLAGIVTQAFPFASWGGNQSLAAMEKLVNAKGGTLNGTGVVNWFPAGKRIVLIAKTIEKIAATVK